MGGRCRAPVATAIVGGRAGLRDRARGSSAGGSDAVVRNRHSGAGGFWLAVAAIYRLLGASVALAVPPALVDTPLPLLPLFLDIRAD